MPRSLESLLREAAAPGDPARQLRAAARLMSLLEQAPQRLPELFQHVPLDDWPQPRLVLGITGAPGSGKSSLTDQFVIEYRKRFPERRVGVIAVDPSSPFTGGAVLGDRVRMMRHATDPKVFIRSLATRGHLGGLSLGVKGVLRIMGLIGCDLVLIETVGVGQSEIEVAGVADRVLVVLAPGQGDSIQMLKAGLMEVGDVFVVNKADLEGSIHLHGQLLAALRLKDDGVVPKVYLVSATDNLGIEELVEGMEMLAATSQARTVATVEDEVREALFEEARHRLREALGHNEATELRRVLRGECSLAALTQELLEKATRLVPEPDEQF